MVSGLRPPFGCITANPGAEVAQSVRAPAL